MRRSQRLGQCCVLVVGVWIAIACRDKQATGAWEEVRGGLVPGIAFRLAGGFSAALAALIARPVMAGGLDPFAAASVRAAVGLVGLSVLARIGALRSEAVVTVSMLALAAISGLLGMAAGMTFVLFALSMRPTGIVTTLASTTPVLLLPLLWLATRKDRHHKLGLARRLRWAALLPSQANSSGGRRDIRANSRNRD